MTIIISFLTKWKIHEALLAISECLREPLPVTLVPMTRCMGISSGRSLKVWSSDILRCWRSRILVRLASRAARSSSKKAAEHLIKGTSLNTRHCHIWLTENFYTTNIHIIIILYTKIILYFSPFNFSHLNIIYSTRH